MEHKIALKNITIANEKIKAIVDEVESLESELRRTEEDVDKFKIEYTLKIEHQINLLLKLKKLNLEKVVMFKKIIKEI